MADAPGEQAEATAAAGAVLALVCALAASGTLLFLAATRGPLLPALAAALGAAVGPAEAAAGMRAALAVVLPLLFAAVALYSVAAKAPGLLSDPARLAALERFIRARAMPVGGVAFLALLAFRFLDMGASPAAGLALMLGVLCMVALAMLARLLAFSGAE